ncbi:glutathione S-transferase family protein [Phreatobacter sp.]|uniref:glutathione S-transferase family protein n=1 Tax=Phreatobacter sp. TaxID=1966341 RepID=UPI003F6F45FD
MITLYHCVSARSIRPLWMLEEMGLPYELKMLPFPPRAMAKEFLALNPLGTVPFMIDGETRMSESTGICHYLATRHGPTPLAVTPDEPDYGTWLNYLYQSDATLTFPQTLVLRYGRFEPPERRQPQVVEDYSKWTLARMRMLDARLQTHEWVAAGRFTAADIAVGYALGLAEIIGLDQHFQPQTAAYWQRLKGREGYRRALAAQQTAAVEQGVKASFG